MSKIISFLKSSDSLLLVSLAITLMVCLLITIAFLFFYSSLPPKLPLFYSLPWGESQLVAKQQFLILPATLLLISLVNALLAHQLHPAHLVLKRILVGSLIFLSVIILITGIKILVIFI